MQPILLAVQLVLTFLLLVAIILPVIRNSYWIFRVFEYPRFQIWLCVLILLGTWVFTFGDASPARKVIAIALSLGFVYLTYKILPYTPLAKRQVKSVPAGDPGNSLRIFTANVYQDNREYDRIIRQVKSFDPDIVLLVETDDGWKEAMDVLLTEYPHYAGKPLPNTYGMILYSRLQLTDVQVRFLVEQNIPGIRATIQLRSGQRINMWGVHPKPPVPGESEDSKAKDSEIMKVAFEAEKSRLPAIVMGDFNDVAWSKVTELFQKTAKLLDPRRGRGFYSTFSAHSLIVRFPLDYIFCSREFGLVSMNRLPKNGSDHFAIVTHLRFEKSLAPEQPAEVADQVEREQARETAAGAH